MAEAAELTGVILKIFTGVQAGVDIALRDGDYSLGSGDEDDIQFFDVSLKPGHAKLSVRGGTMQIAASAGQLRTRNGIVLEPGSAPVDLEPLDIVTIGTTRFALGQRGANWASITDAEREDPEGLYATPKPRRRPASTTRRRWPVVLAVAVPLAAIAVGVGVATMNGPRQSKPEEEAVRTNLSIVQDALAAFDFRDRLTLVEEPDKSLSLSGFVDDATQRRGVMSAVQATGIPVRARITVLATISEEVKSLLEGEKADVTFTLSPVGVLTLNGVILDAAQAKTLVEMVKEQVPGLADVDSRIRTSETLLADVEGLAERAQIKPLVLLRFDGQLIEATGALPTEKIDAWAGFLQAYATQFAPIISLRSFVQLQSPGVTVVAGTEANQPALYLGAGTGGATDIAIDQQRLKTGNFGPADLFANQIPAQLLANVEEQRAAAPTTDRKGIDVAGLLGLASTGPADTPTSVLLKGDAGGQATGTQTTETPTGTDGGTTDNGQGQTVGGGPIAVLDDANLLGRELVLRWQAGTLGQSSDATSLGEDLQRLEQSSVSGPAQPLSKRYAPLLAGAVPQTDRYQPCWHNSRLSHATVTGALFWLDLLSVSRELSLADLDKPTQALVLEAALSPRWTARCATEAAGGDVQSPFLYEVERNPDFVKYIARDIGTFPIDVAGVNMAGDRYIQTRSGQKMGEGAAPDDTSRLVLVGELGAAFQRDDGYSTYLFGSTLNWRTQ